MLLGLILLSGCATQGLEPEDWSGGPVTPTPLPVQPNPSRPAVDGVPTGVVIEGNELVLYVWGDIRYLSTAWRDVQSGEVRESPLNGTGTTLDVSRLFAETSGVFTGVSQIVFHGDTLVEIGAIQGTPSRITSEDNGVTVEAKFATCPSDRTLTLFWVERHGTPIPSNSPAGVGLDRPLEPEKYPLITAYDIDGAVLARTRIRPPGGQQKGG